MSTAVVTTAASGNWSSGSTWTGGSKPAAGQVASIGHDVTVDSDQTTGTGGPTCPGVLGGTDKPTLSSVAGGGSLAAGTYYARVTHVDASGNESSPGNESASLALSSGNTLRATFADTLSGAAVSRNLYIGPTGAEKLYATGITGSTYDCTSASWTDGTTSQASAASPPTASGLIMTAGNLTVSQNVKLTVKGDFRGKDAKTLTIGSNGGGTGLAGVEFDVPSGEVYYLWYGETFGARFNLNIYGLASTYNSYLRWKSGGGAVVIRDGWSLSGTAWGSHLGYSWNNATIKLGNSGNSSTWSSSGGTGNLSTNGICRNVDFNGGGQINVNANAANVAIDWLDVWFQNSVNASYPVAFFGNASPTATRTLERVRFMDRVYRPLLAGNNQKHKYCYFGAGVNINTAGSPGRWHSTEGFYRCWVRQCDATSYEAYNGNLYDSLFVADTASSAAYSGTAASATGTTLTASGSPGWTTNQYQAASSAGLNGWCVYITGGTGVGQCRSICANTSSQLTVSRSWDTTPDATSTFAIYNHIANPHFVTVAPVAGQTTVFDGCIWWNSGADNNGDCTLTGGTATGTGTDFVRCIGLPSAARDNSGTMSSTDSGFKTPTTYKHMTWFTGAQPALSLNEGADTSAGKITAFQDSIFWCDPSLVTKYTIDGGPITPDAGSSLGPYAVNDLHSPISGAPLDVIVSGSAKNNCLYGYKSGAYAGTAYNARMTSPGTGDVLSDPNFVDRWANPATWAKSAGYTSSDDTRAQWIAADAAIAVDPTRIDAYLTYQRHALAPQLLSLHYGASDGTDIGAVAWYGVEAKATLAATLGAITLAGSATATAPSPSAGTLSATLGAISLASTATVVQPQAFGTLSATLGAIAIAASATATTPAASTGSLTATLGGITLTGSATAGTVGAATGTLNATLGAIAIGANAIATAPTAAVGSLSATLGAITLSATAIAAAAPGDVRTPFEAALLAYLSADASIAAVNPTRIVAGRIPQRVKDGTPAIGFRVISRRPVNNLDGDTGYTKARVQIGSLGKDAPEAERTAFAVRRAIAAMPWSISGIEIAAAFIDEIDGEDDAIPTGTDSTRTDYTADAQIHYREDLGLDP